MVEMPRPSWAAPAAQTTTDDDRPIWQRMNDPERVERRKTGRPRLVNDPQVITDAVQDYIAYCARNPLTNEKIVPRPKSTLGYVRVTQEKVRVPTQIGLCLWLDISRDAWSDWKRNRPDLLEAINNAEQMLYETALQAASADQTNANIVSRLIGLTDKKEVTTTDGPPPPPPIDERLVANKTHPDMTDADAEAIYGAGLSPMLFSQAQLDAGIPWAMPKLPSADQDSE